MKIYFLSLVNVKYLKLSSYTIKLRKMAKRKRTRPTYLCDYMEEDSDYEQEAAKTVKLTEEFQPFENVSVQPQEGKCCLCEEDIVNGFDLERSTGSSELTFSEVLNKIFSSINAHHEQIPKLIFRNGLICSFCKIPIQDLDLLQHKILGLQKVILKRAERKLEKISETQKLKTEKKEKKLTKSNGQTNTKDNSLTNKKIYSKNFNNKIRKCNRNEKNEVIQCSPDSRPRREKQGNTMSDIERAKIKNLPIDLKFQMKKRIKRDIYIIEYLKEKKGNKYLVKWENRHENENSWESKSRIPQNVLQYYEEDLSRLGSPVSILSIETKNNETNSHQEINNEENISIDDEVLENKESVSDNDNPMPTEGEANGEYIEDPGDEILSELHNSKTECESLNTRKSQRDPKPKRFYDDIHSKNSRSKDTKKKRLRADSAHKRQPATTTKEPKNKEVTYIIESLVEKNGGKYLVKWENYPSSQNTWEPKSALPKFIVKFYEQDLSRLGMPAPDVS